MAEPKIRLLCVDDHSVVRDGISVVIELQNDMEVVALAATGEEAIEQFRQHRPDVTLMDLQLPGISGLEAIRAIRREDNGARIIVLTMYDGEEDIYRALEAGAATYLLKDALTKDLIRSIREVHAGKNPMPHEIAVRLSARAAQAELTPREVDVVRLVAVGKRNKEIAATLGIAEETVHAHVKSIFSKLNVSDRIAAVMVALRRGIIHLK